MKKAQKRSLIAVILVGALIYYAGSAYNRFYNNAYLNNEGKALSATILLAFGQTEYLEPYAPIATLNPDVIKNECLLNHRDNGISCLLASFGSTDSLYQKNCSWWKLENCAGIIVDPLFLKHPELNKALLEVLHNPCKYLPSDAAILEEEKKNHSVPSWVIGTYSTHRETLNCDAIKSDTIKVIQSYRNQPDETANIFTLDLGGKK